MLGRKTTNEYSIKKEIEYYRGSKTDRSAVPYDHLDQYFRATMGVNFFAGKRVLDIGSGEGVYSAWIADVGKAASVVGLELTHHRIRTEYARRLPNLGFVCGDVFKAPIMRKQFDVVFTNLVLHHVRFGLDRVAESIGSFLRPGGSFLAFEPNVYSPFAVAAHLYHDRSANEGFLSPRTIRKGLLGAGFRDVEYGFFWRDRKWARNPVLASSFWILAELE